MDSRHAEEGAAKDALMTRPERSSSPKPWSPAGAGFDLATLASWTSLLERHPMGSSNSRASIPRARRLDGRRSRAHAPSDQERFARRPLSPCAQ